MITSILISFLILFLTIYCQWKRGKRLPPGPFALPIVGNALSLGNCSHETLAKWGKQYGPIFRIYLGRKLVIVLNDINIIKEALLNQANNFSGRPWPSLFASEVINGRYAYKCNKKEGKNDTSIYGLLLCEGQLWKEQRHFALTTLKDFGFGKNILQEKITEEIMYVMEEIDIKKGQPFDIGGLLSMAANNIIYSLSFGKRHDYNNKEFIQILKSVETISQSSGSSNILNTFPPSRFFIKKAKILFNNLHEGQRALTLNHNTLIKEHLERFNPAEINDYIDAFINQMKLVEKEETTFTTQQLKASINSLFLVGTDTTATTLRWGILYLILNPDIQKKVQKEIDDIIGSTRSPRITDQINMPYMEATIMEIHRISSIVPFSIPRSNFEKTTLLGYDIPERSLIFSNLWAINMNEDLWKNPEKFDPTHFLDDQGKVKKPENFIPFSIGKRSCLGKSFAKMELFLFFTSFLQRYSFCLPEGAPLPSLKPIVGITLNTQPYELCAIPR